MSLISLMRMRDGLSYQPSRKQNTILKPRYTSSLTPGRIQLTYNSKAEAEHYVLKANRSPTLLTTSLRPAGIFGEGDVQLLPQCSKSMQQPDRVPVRRQQQPLRLYLRRQRRPRPLPCSPRAPHNRLPKNPPIRPRKGRW